MIPQSALTLERPDIWLRAVGLAEGLTGYNYPHKAPLADGTILACGGYYQPDPEVVRKNRRDSVVRRKRELEDVLKYRKEHPHKEDYYETPTKDIEKQIEEYEQEIKDLGLLASVLVPEGAMEWLLHEVGHWVSATSQERSLPNYGYGTILCPDDTVLTGTGADREWQSWALEEIILAPFGPSRSFVAPEHGGGVAFSKNQIPEAAMRHTQRQIESLNIDVAHWRAVYGEWVRWTVQ